MGNFLDATQIPIPSLPFCTTSKLDCLTVFSNVLSPWTKLRARPIFIDRHISDSFCKSVMDYTVILNSLIVWTFSNYQLNAQFVYSSTICVLHYDPQHVSSSTLLILRRANCIITASGIVTLHKQPYSMQVESGLQSALYLHTVYRGWRYQRLWWYNWSSWGWAACCSKHVEENSVTYILLKNKRIVY